MRNYIKAIGGREGRSGVEFVFFDDESEQSTFEAIHRAATLIENRHGKGYGAVFAPSPIFEKLFARATRDVQRHFETLDAERDEFGIRYVFGCFEHGMRPCRRCFPTGQQIPAGKSRPDEDGVSFDEAVKRARARRNGRAEA